MKLYLSRKANGLYQLTKLAPVVTEIIHTGKMDVFVQPGDPINFQGLCPIAVKMLFEQELEPCEVTRIDLVGTPLPHRTRANEFGSAPGVMVATQG